VTIIHIPNYYRPLFDGGPDGPLRWQDDVTGFLPAAMLAYFEHKATPEQFSLVCEYGEYYIHAPCWDWNPHLTEEGKQELAQVRNQIKSVTTEQDLSQWMYACLDLGIDPF